MSDSTPSAGALPPGPLQRASPICMVSRLLMGDMEVIVSSRTNGLPIDHLHNSDARERFAATILTCFECDRPPRRQCVGDAYCSGFDHAPGGLLDCQPRHLAGLAGRVVSPPVA